MGIISELLKKETVRCEACGKRIRRDSASRCEFCGCYICDTCRTCDACAVEKYTEGSDWNAYRDMRERYGIDHS